MSTLDELLRQFQQAQQDIYSYLGVSRQMAHRAVSEVPVLRYKHIGGNEDITNAYPEIIDYRSKGWRRTSDEINADDEIHVKIWNAEDWSQLNTIRFNILTLWADREAGVICAVCNHLPKVYELSFFRTHAIKQVERGVNFYGDSCLLILSPKLKSSR